MPPFRADSVSPWSGLAPITVLEVWEAIRKRPTMYVGPLDEETPNRLLQEALCMTRAAAFKGEVSKVTLWLDREGRCRFEDDGPGWSVDFHPNGQRRAELHLTMIGACREAKDPEHRGLCNNGIVTLVALSSSFIFRTFREGGEWVMEFDHGKPKGPMTRVTNCGDRHGTSMSFVLDKTVLPYVEFDFEKLRPFFHEMSAEMHVMASDHVGTYEGP